ncbi:MAG: peptidylprolyl isomerase [Acidobacteria bacterium]|nr:peptidylprolyl isomerase [Acidobacteriota bacterium]
MTLRPMQSLQFSAVLAASMVIVALPSWGQSARNASVTDRSTQQQSPYQGTVVEDIVARVNDQVISKSDFDRAEQNLEAEARQQGWSQQELYQQKADLLRNLIDQQLLISKGKQLDITGENELVRRLDEIRKQNHLDSLEDLQKAAEAQGVSYEDFKANIRNSIITSQVIRDEVGRHISITPSEVQQYYDQHKSDFDKPEQVRLSEILIPTANPDDAQQVAAAKTKAEDIESKLKGGADFAALAKSSSGGPTAAQGGDLGDFKRGQLAKVLEDRTFDKQAGQYTEPIRTKQGFVILKVVDHTPGGVTPINKVEPQVEDAVGMEKMQPALRAYLTRLREEAYIDIKPGFTDAGASPNELKPVYSAYTPPGPKKKKHVTRARYRTKTRKADKARTAKAVPSNVPSLDQVPQGNATVASSAAPARTKSQMVAGNAPVQKPGKKEKIRFGQAPRRTLPQGDTKSEDAGAVAPTSNTTPGAAQAESQVAQNSVAPDIRADGQEQQQTEKKAKKRFADQAKVKKDKKHAARQDDPYAPPPESSDELASRKVQSAPLGLSGDTATKKKVKKANTGEKTRFADQGRKDKESKQQNTAPAATPPASQNQDQSATPAAPSPSQPQ